MRNMKVSKKLIVSFLIVIVMAIAVGVAGIYGMAKMNSGDDDLYNKKYLPTVMAGDISQHIVEQRVYIRNLVIYDVYDDADIFRKAQSDLAENRRTMDILITDYQKDITETDDQAKFDEFVRIYRNEWAAITANIEELGLQNKTVEAKAALTNATTIAGQLDQITTDLQRINLDDGKETVDANTDSFYFMTFLEIGVLVLAIGVALFFAFHISSLIAKPLVLMSSFLKKAGLTGDINLRPEDVTNINAFGQAKDELGECISSCASFISRIQDVSKALEIVSNGDLTSDLELLSENDVMGKSLQKMISNLNTMFSEINASTTQVSIGSKQIADGAQVLAQGSTEQAAAVQQLSSSISDISDKTKENANMASRAADLGNVIKGNAEKGSSQMDQMVQAVKEINDASQSISKVIKVIDNIAFQTNILALNAAVEAARAGQHGKGFAVVAEEVRSLAAKSADAAAETAGLIENSVEKAELGARIAGETAASLVEIVTGINESSHIVSDIAHLSEEQALAITQINTGIDQVAQVVQQNSATAEESAAASEEMSGQADLLEQLISQFKLKNDGPGYSSISSGSGNRRLPASGGSARQQPSGGGDGGFGKY